MSHDLDKKTDNGLLRILIEEQRRTNALLERLTEAPRTDTDDQNVLDQRSTVPEGSGGGGWRGRTTGDPDGNWEVRTT